MRILFGRTTLLAFTAAVGVSLLAGAAPAATFHVSPVGSNTPPYDTYAKAAHQVADAVLASSGYGDTVLVHAGTYDIDTTMEIPVGVTWAGVGRDSVSLVWRGSGLILSRVYGDNEIYGIAFVNGWTAAVSPDVRGVFMTISTGWLKVHQCRFDQLCLESGTTGDREVFENEFVVWSAQGCVSWDGNKIWIHHNTFFGGVGGLASGGEGVQLTEGDVLIEHNVFDYSQTGGRGIPILVDRFPDPVVMRNNLLVGGEWAVLWFYANGAIENNTIIGPDSPYGGMEFHQDADDTLIIRNNVLQDFVRVPLFSNACSSCPAAGPITHIHNGFWPPVDSFFSIPASRLGKVPVLDSANFNGYPMYADDSSYHLQYSSPLIDAGDPAVKDADSSRSDVGWWGGPGGSAYVYPDLPPTAPESLKYDYAYPMVSLWWYANHEADLQSYAIHRDAHAGFLPATGNRIGTTSAIDTTFTDSLHDSLTGAYYKVVAIDATAHESPPSNEMAVIPTGVFDPEEPAVGVPRTPRLLGNYPNPFNSSTVFEVYIPAIGSSPAPVAIIIYDALGRRAAVAYSGPMAPGTHQITWDGCDSAGHPLASGVYFAKLKCWSLTIQESVKVVVVR